MATFSAHCLEPPEKKTLVEMVAGMKKKKDLRPDIIKVEIVAYKKKLVKVAKYTITCIKKYIHLYSPTFLLLVLFGLIVLRSNQRKHCYSETRPRLYKCI